MAQAFKELQAALHPVYARLLCAELQRRGFAPAEILEGTQLEWQALHHSNRFLNFDQMRRLIRRGLVLSQCPWLGLEVGLRTQASAHGTLGAAMIASSSLPNAMLLLQRYAGLRQNLAALEFEHTPVFTAVLHEWVDLGDVREYLHCQLLGGLVQLLTALTGRELPALLSIEWPFEAPAWRAQYLRIAQSNTFGVSRLRVLIDDALVNSPSLAADEEALQRLLRDCDLQLQHLQQGGTLSQRVRMTLERTEGAMPTLKAMAKRENMTERTLMRHLQAEGCNFQGLLDEVRKERAVWLLQNTSKTAEEVALALGYEDPSNFSRTFKRWFEMTPSDYRRQSQV